MRAGAYWSAFQQGAKLRRSVGLDLGQACMPFLLALACGHHGGHQFAILGEGGFVAELQIDRRAFVYNVAARVRVHQVEHVHDGQSCFPVSCD